MRVNKIKRCNAGQALVTASIIFFAGFCRVFYVTLRSNSNSSRYVAIETAESNSNRRVTIETVVASDAPTERNDTDTAVVCHFDVAFSSNRATLKRGVVEGASVCPDVRRPLPGNLRTNGPWQLQDEASDKLVLYSAFYDDRRSAGELPWLRIIGVAKLNRRRSLFCQVWYADCDRPYVAPVTVSVTGRSYGHTIYQTRYVQYLFSCQLPSVKPVPERVSVVSEQCSRTSSIYLRVERPARADPDVEFGVCVAISFGSIPTEQLVEWLEFNWLLGVREFNIYDGGMVNMTKVFDQYVQRRWLNVYQMPPPAEELSKDGTPTINSIKLASAASLNDCMQRNVYRYRYTVVIDFDEFIIPRFHADYAAMLAYIDRNQSVATAAAGQQPPYTYTFQNTYYFLSFRQDETQPQYLASMRYRRRIQPLGIAPKSFVSGRSCLSVFNHHCYISLRAPGESLVHVNVDPSVARSHHYRYCNFDNALCRRNLGEGTLDDVTLRFRDRLQPAVEQSLRQLGWTIT